MTVGEYIDELQKIIKELSDFDRLQELTLSEDEDGTFTYTLGIEGIEIELN